MLLPADQRRFRLPDDDDALVTTEELADLLRVEPPTIRWWRHVGRGPKGASLPSGRRILYRAGDVRAWMNSAEASNDEAQAS